MNRLNYFCNVENFYQHIEKLLAEHDYVVVPGLGGFIVQMQSAIFLSDRITPPQATIGFNPLLQHADGLLAIEIARSEQISYRMAVESIDNEVEKINSKLNSTGNLIIGNLGIMEKNAEGNIIFSPIYKAGFLPQNFGLSDLYITTKEKNNTDKPVKITFTMPARHNYKYAAAALLLFGLFLSTNRVSDIKRPNTASIASLSFLNPPVTAPKIKEVIKDTVFNTIVVKKDTMMTTVVPQRFEVIVASTTDQNSAEKFCQELKKKDYPEAHKLVSNKTCRVAIKSFATKKEAVDYMEFIRVADSRFETAWVYCN